MADTGNWKNPTSWAMAIQGVGPSYAIIFALLAMLGFLAFKGVPAVMALTMAIQQNTDEVAGLARGQEYNQALIIANQTKVIDNETEIIKQHESMQLLLDRTSTAIDDLIADDRARSAHDTLRKRGQ